MSLHGDHGSAWRRRQRRLRSWWRYEQQSVAMALSAAAHHSFDKVAAGEKCYRPRAQKTDTVREAANKDLWRQKSKAAGDAVFFELLDEDTAGVRPGVLVEPPPQERVQRHTMEHIVDFVCCAPVVQILDAPVPQTVEQLPDVLRFFDRLMSVPEQVIEVPQILPEDVSLRAVLRDPQLAEQLVEVPTIVSYSWLQLRLEQNDDIPVPGRGERSSGLQGLLPGQGSTALLSSEERISERIVEQIVDFPGGGLQNFRPGQSSSSSSHVPARVHEDANEPGVVFFALFPKIQKVRSRVRTRVRECPLVLAHPRRLSSVFVSRSGSWALLREHGHSWRRAPILAGGGEMASTSTLATTDYGDVVVGLGSWWRRLCAGAACQLWRLSEEFPVSRGRCRAVRTWKPGLRLRLRSFSPCPVFGCCLGSTAYGFSGTLPLIGSTVDTCLREAFVNFQLFLH